VITDSDQKNTPRNTPSTYLDFRVDINAIPTTGIDDFSFSILTSTAPNLSFELEVVKYHPDLYIASSDNNNILRETHDLTLTFYEKNDGFPTAQNTV
jgi:hypothetical protein